jgi:leucyl/phenylalanyl-tRNA--protein transferase
LPIFRLDERLRFPSPELADEGGLLAVGGDLRPERLLLAYSMGIFPWYSSPGPILWHAPDPRAVLEPRALHLAKSLARRMRGHPYRIRVDSGFALVVRACAEARRPGQRGTWITRDMQRAYAKLHELGHAHSVEAWDGEHLVGGLYGVAIGGMFFGESMFATADDASKICFALLVRQLARWKFPLIDCQQKTQHLMRFGAVMWPRSRFQTALRAAIELPPHPGPWRFDADLEDLPPPG